MSSAKSRSSSWSMNLHLIPLSANLVVSHIIQSMARRNKNPDITQPFLTPVSTLNHSEVWPPSRTAHSLSWCRSWTILMIFIGIPYDFMMSQRLGRCSESKAFSKSMKLMTRGVCHSYDCSIMLRKMKICSVVFLPCQNPACSALSLLLTPLFKRSMRILPNTLLAITRSVIPRQFVHSFKLPFFGSLTISPFNHSCGITSFSQSI